MGCKVHVNRHGRLCFRIYYKGREFWEGTALLDTQENRKDAEALSRVISKTIRKGSFNYLDFFPQGNRADEFKPKQPESATIGEYYLKWIERKKTPVIRKGLARDYRDHFRLYILPKFEDTKIEELTP